MNSATTLVFIHGNGATKDSFNYIKNNIDLSEYQIIDIEYKSDLGFYTNLLHISMYLQQLKLNKVFFIAHSLGGIYAKHLANDLSLKDNVVGAVTISTPYGGCASAYLLRIINQRNKLLRDIAPSSKPITSLNVFPENWNAVVTTRGSLLYVMEKNDGVVTYRSMTVHKNKMNIIEIDSTHFEIMLSPKLILFIKEKLDLIK